MILLEQARAYFTQKKNKKFLQKFAQNQNAYAGSENLSELLKHAKISSLMFLARAYSKADVEMSIEILKGLLNRPLKDEEKIAVLDLLAKNYFSVGYLQKTKDTVKEILRFSPRNVEALLKLLHAYELEKDYSKALETLECLEELETPEIETIKNYLYLMHLIENNKEDAAKILHVSKASLDLKKIALNHLKSHDENLFWQEIDATERLENAIDLLWDMNIPAFILEKHAVLQDIARSQGLLLDNKPCQVFELEVLRTLLNSPIKASLTFEYRCKHCKQIFPFESHRCPVCYQLAFMDMVLKISKETHAVGVD